MSRCGYLLIIYRFLNLPTDIHQRVHQQDGHHIGPPMQVLYLNHHSGQWDDSGYADYK